MKYVLDTNAVSALMRGDPRAVARLRRTAKGDVGLPQPVVAEVEYGISRLPRSKRRRELEERLGLLLSELPRVAWTDEVSRRFGRVEAHLESERRRIEDFDVAIAAHALSEGRALVSADGADMGRIPGLRVEDWTR